MICLLISFLTSCGTSREKIEVINTACTDFAPMSLSSKTNEFLAMGIKERDPDITYDARQIITHNKIWHAKCKGV